jgi:hypothetical protein
MIRAGAFSCCLVIASAATSADAGQGADAGQPASVLDALTAPQATLPAGCALTPAPSERIGEGRVRSGFWGSLPIPSNPWAGEDLRVLPEIRTRMFGPSLMPDGPPDARIAKQIGRDLVAGLSGYAAFYRQGEARVGVYALRSATPLRWTRASPVENDGSTGQAVARINSRHVAVLAMGDRGPCFASVERHLRAAVSTAGPAPVDPPPR